MLSQAGGGEFLSNSLFLEMNRTMPEIIYRLVARGSTVLADFTKSKANNCQISFSVPFDWSFRRLTRLSCMARLLLLGA
jgi:hypothetical protein